MPIPVIRNLLDTVVNTFNPLAGTPSGSRVSIPSPVRGRLVEVGIMPTTVVTSGMTIAVSVTDNTATNTASNYVQCVTSTLGTVSSVNLYEGAVFSVTPPNVTYVNAGDGIQFTASGGNTSTIGATFYAIVRKG